MRVAGFTFVRNAILYDYPIVEAITSVLPLCDYFVVAVGQSDDDTLLLVRSIGDPRIHIVETVWDDALRAGGKVLAEETNKAFDAIPSDCDWCIYVQGDECLHEQDHPAIRESMEAFLTDAKTEGLLFSYKHFYGSYDYAGASRRWYRNEVRVIRNDKSIRSYRDAQGFRKWDNGKLRKLTVRAVPAAVYHYGWVKHPDAQQRKQLNFHKLWHSDEWVHTRIPADTNYQYDGSEPLQRFSGTHPGVMHPRIRAANWQFENDPTNIRGTLKERFSLLIEKWTGWRMGEYRNYKIFRERKF